MTTAALQITGCTFKKNKDTNIASYGICMHACTHVLEHVCVYMFVCGQRGQERERERERMNWHMSLLFLNTGNACSCILCGSVGIKTNICGWM